MRNFEIYVDGKLVMTLLGDDKHTVKCDFVYFYPEYKGKRIVVKPV